MPTDITKLQFSLDIDGRRAKRTIEAMEASFKRGLGRIGDAAEGANDLLKGLEDTAESFGVEYSKGLMLSQKQLIVLTKKQEDLHQQLHDTRIELSRASAEEKVGIKKSIQGLEDRLSLIKEIRENQKGLDFGAAFHEAIEANAKEYRDEMESAFKGFVGFDRRKMTKEVGASLSDAMSGLGSKSFGGMARGIGGALGGLGKGAVGKMAQMGGAVSAMTGIAGTLTKLGPALSMTAGAVMAIVKLFIDADAAAKEFQKELLSTASTGEFLATAGGRADIAFEDLHATVKSIRGAAFDAKSNLEWGTTSKDHLALLGVLNQEGVSLGRIRDEAEASRKEVGRFSADMVHVAVAFSRNFGVSLTEIAQFQGEMMTELGTKAKDIAGSFAQISQAASDSGIAQNKFFQMIRSISTDLSLYNNRLEDSVQLLKLVGKAMSPRNAQKFMQETAQGLKNMGRTEKLKLSLLAGDKKVTGILNREMKNRREDLAEKLKAAGATGSIDDIASAIDQGGEALEKHLGKANIGGDLQEAITQYGIDKQRAGKGTFGKATALGNAGPGAVLDLYTAALAKFGGGKNLSEGAGSIGMEMMAEQLGLSQERLDAMIKVEKAVDKQRKLMKKQATDEGKGIEELKKIDEMGSQEIIRSMSADAKKDLDAAQQVTNYAKTQAELTQSVSEKLQIIIDFLLNQAYDVFMGIWDTISNLLPGGANDRKRTEMTVARTKNKELMEAFKSSADQEDFKRKAYRTGTFKAQEAVIYQNPGKAKELEARSKELGLKAEELRKQGKTDEANAVESESRSLVEEREALVNAYNKVVGSISANLGGAGNSNSLKRQRLQEAIRMAEVNNDDYDQRKMKSMAWHLSQGRDIEAAGTAAGFSEEDVAKIIDKIRLTLSDDQLAHTFQGVAPGAAASGATAATPSAAIAPPPSKEKPATVEQQAQTTTAIESVADGQKKLGFDKGNVKNTFQPAIENGTLDALRTALFEYYMYSGLDRGSVAAGLKAGTFNATNFGKQVVQNSTATGTVMVPPANAEGGVVARPPSGEFFASVAPGETIVPRGGATQGGGSVNITLNVNGIGGQDLARHLENKVNEGIYEYKRREKFH
jgi:hypothetical protein